MQKSAATALLLLAAVAPAAAHTGTAAGGALASGFAHPLLGADHVLAMLAVGLWAALAGGRAVWVLPAAFLALMAAGFGAALAGLALPMVEPAILASLVALGLLVAGAARLPLAAGAALAGFFALFHGAAHGAELGHADAAGFGLGFLAATALLHAAGLVCGAAVAGRFGPLPLRLAGGATALAGVVLAAG